MCDQTPADSKLADRLADEYKFQLARWDDFDKRTHVIKGWIAAGSIIGFLGIGKGSDANSINKYAIAAACLVVLSAWFLDATLKSWQHAHHQRIQTIERFFRNEISDIAPYQVHTAILRKSGKTGLDWIAALKEMPRPFVMIPYAPVLIYLILYIIFE